MKRCTLCDVERPETEFPWRDGRHLKRRSYCRHCRRERNRAAKERWYKDNTESAKAKAKIIRAAQRERFDTVVQEIKQTNPCADCGRYDPYYLMQFDHLRDKEAAISQMRNVSIKRVLVEIAKCDLVCVRCHGIRTHMRGYSTMASAPAFQAEDASSTLVTHSLREEHL